MNVPYLSDIWLFHHLPRYSFSSTILFKGSFRGNPCLEVFDTRLFGSSSQTLAHMQQWVHTIAITRLVENSFPVFFSVRYTCITPPIQLARNHTDFGRCLFLVLYFTLFADIWFRHGSLDMGRLGLLQFTFVLSLTLFDGGSLVRPR